MAQDPLLPLKCVNAGALMGWFLSPSNKCHDDTCVLMASRSERVLSMVETWQHSAQLSRLSVGEGGEAGMLRSGASLWSCMNDTQKAMEKKKNNPF